MLLLLKSQSIFIVDILKIFDYSGKNFETNKKSFQTGF
ncbi:hypothetical protein BGS_0964 [Beggiatoa sp. SS]|nr:hypothetical protein BGS_0964 [Beggiatoa sp. SS]